jgi:hypothetical protein
MNTELANSVIPSAVFFFAFFVAFSILELLIIFILNKLERQHWEFVIDTLIRAKVHHGRAIKIVALLGIFLVLALILLLTPFVDVVRAATQEFKTFIAILLTVMLVIYYTTTRKVTKMALEKRVHGYIYFLISCVVFTFVVIMADQSYNTYKNYMNSQLIEPAAQKISAEIDEQEAEKALSGFREDYLAGRCEAIDYKEEKPTAFTHFVYARTDDDLAVEGAKMVDEKGLPLLKGHRCINGENTVLLTEAGKWYWVITE